MALAEDSWDGVLHGIQASASRRGGELASCSLLKALGWWLRAVSSFPARSSLPWLAEP